MGIAVTFEHFNMYKFAFLLTLAFVGASGKNIDDSVRAEECKDNAQYAAWCPSWVWKCTSSSFMMENCPMSCGACGKNVDRSSMSVDDSSRAEECEDNAQYAAWCPTWVWKCTSSSFMMENCPMSCGACGKKVDRWSMSVDDCFRAEECRDNAQYAANCPLWASVGKCTSSSTAAREFTLENCPMSCGACSSDLPRAFECGCDYSGDGGVSASEFQTCFRSTSVGNYLFGNSNIASNYFVTMTYHNYDANNDGKIDYQEATAWSADFTPPARK